MKKKKILVYLACMSIPMIIFLVCATINGYVPFGDELLNSYDSFTQYPGMLLEYARLLRGGNIFYSWGAGLGFNFFSTLTYYCMSPLNLFCLLATPQNYHIFIAIMTFMRFALLGGAMCFYLDHKNLAPWQVVLFSTIYALMGYTSTYYYNFIWIDSVIMLPLVIHGLDKLIDENRPTFYIIVLALTIVINYYIGYMICIFSLLWFLYRLVGVDNRGKIIKTFFISSLLAGLATSVVILPSFFALLTGKADLYGTTRYWGITRNAYTFFYTLTAGSYQATEQMYGPALVYTTIFVFVLTIFYFFNGKFTKKEKISTFAVILFFYLSFSIKFLNYAWQFFQQPIWWQSRFSFTFSFFSITVAYKSLREIGHVKMVLKWRLLLIALFIAALFVGAHFKWHKLPEVEMYSYIFLGFSVLIFIEMMFLLDKKSFLVMLIIFTGVELTLNTYNSLKNNYKGHSFNNYAYIKEEVPGYVEKLQEENDNFFRMEFLDDYTSDDGLYFGFNGVNYFNSIRNMDVLDVVERLGVSVLSEAHIEIDNFDPVVLSLLNVKYLYGNRMNYFEEIDRRLYENPYPLSIGFMANKDIRDVELLEDDPYANKENVVKALSGLDKDLYEEIPLEEFEVLEGQDTSDYIYEFTSDDHYFLLPSESGEITIDGKTEDISKRIGLEISPGSKVKVVYTVSNYKKESQVFLQLLRIENFVEHMKALEKEILVAKTNIDGHILEGHITSSGRYDYLFTSIEYEEGMRVYVDEREVEPEIVLGAFLGIPLSEGEHEIKIDYVPRGFKGGLALSLLSVAAIALYLQIHKKVI